MFLFTVTPSFPLASANLFFAPVGGLLREADGRWSVQQSASQSYTRSTRIFGLLHALGRLPPGVSGAGKGWRESAVCARIFGLRRGLGFAHRSHVG